MLATTSPPEGKDSSHHLQQSKESRLASSPPSSANGGVTSFTEGVKDRILGFLTPNQETSLPAIVESSESGFEEGNLTGSTVPTSSPASEIFVGAREFFAENETRDRLNSDYFTSSDTPSRQRESTRRLSIRKPFNQYIAYSSDEELDEWRNQPKSDYTYAASLTYRSRVTPDRKIGSPNMSRRGLRGGNLSYIKSPDFSMTDSSNETDDSSHLNLRTRTVLRPMDALSDNSDVEGEGVVEAEPVSRRTRSSRSRSTDPTLRVNGSTVTRTITTCTTTTTKTLHRGLDVDSDVDDGTESTVPQRATPFTGRSGTPLARAPTPAGIRKSRSSVTRDTVSRGYTLAKGAIAEDVEEEDLAENEHHQSLGRLLSWRSVKKITTYVTTSVIMSVVRTVMARQSDAASSVSSSEKSSRFYALSNISSKSQQVLGAGAGMLTASRDYLKKRPVLIWIPLIPLLIFLALIASWWLFQSGAETDDSADTTQTTDGPSFLSFILASASDVTNLMINGIWYGPILVWGTILDVINWVVSMCSVCLSASWSAVTSMGMWLGSTAQYCLTYFLETIYLILELLQNMALAVATFFTSSLSYVFGFILPTNGSEEVDELQSQSTSTWLSSTSMVTWVSEAHSSVSQAAHKTQILIWDGWLWLVISVADALTAGLSSILWLLAFLWSSIMQLMFGLWTTLVYIFTGATSLVFSSVNTVTYGVVETFSAIAGVSKLVFLPFSKTSESFKSVDSTVFAPQTAPIEAHRVSDVGIEEIVRGVLESPELTVLITSISQNTVKTQKMTEEINIFVKSLVERELNAHKTETATLWESHSKTTAQETNVHITSIKEQQQELLKQLEGLGAEVTTLQGSIKVGLDGQDQHQHHLEILRSQVDKLTLQLRDLENNHTNLASKMKDCCKNASLTLADVEKHVTALLGDIFSVSKGEDDSSGGKSWSAADVGAWLRSYFVAKEELETRLNTLTSMLHKKAIEGNEIKESNIAASNAAIAQSTQTIMDTVLEKLRVEIHKQHKELSETTSHQVNQQVNTQMQAAAAVLGKQVSEQVEHQLRASQEQLKKSISVAVEETIPKHVDSVVSEAVSAAITKAVADSVPIEISAIVPGMVKEAVGDAVGTSVDAAVPEAFASAITEAVNAAVPNVVTKVVADFVPKALEKTLPETVTAAAQEAVSAEVQGAITVTVSEAIASVLPAAVATAVNESVASRISETVVDAKLRTNDGNGKGINEDGMVVVSGTHSKTSSSISGARHSATVNVSRNVDNGSNMFGSVSLPMTGGLNESAVLRIVKEALLKYDADKTGMVDYALESAGGNIVSTRCTENYQVHRSELRILGFSLYRYPANNDPSIIIQPERMPGQCWAFKGSLGYIVIKLAGSVLPTGFTIEHIPKSLSPTGEIDSAPREFEVWGLQSESDEGVRLGNYEYDRNGDPFQYFPVKEPNTQDFPYIELKINSNHGNLQYTCLYRFRVHGVRRF